MARIRRTALGALATAITALAAPASSHATDSLTCEFVASTSNMTAIPAMIDDLGSGNGLGVESGTYTVSTALRSLTKCLHVDDDVLAPNDTGLYNATIDGNGTYHNLLCGTGTTDGNATLIVSGNSEIDRVEFSFHIDFVGGQGVAQTIANLSTTVAGVTVGTKSTATAYKGTAPPRPVNGAGTVHLIGRSPSQTIPCVNSYVTGFDVFGTLSGVF
jgi:hypothetical protein